MNRKIWMILFAALVFAVARGLCAQEKNSNGNGENISIIDCSCPRWSPKGDEIGFVGEFNKIMRNGDKEELYMGYSICAINQNGYNIRNITPINWVKRRLTIANPLNPLDRHKQEKVSFGDYSVSKKQSTDIKPIISPRTIFSWSTNGAKIFFADSLFSSSDDDDIYLWSINSDGSGLRSILNTAGHLVTCLQCLDNGKIAISTGTTENVLYFLNPDGTKNSQWAILGNRVDNNPSLTNDGKKLALGSGDIYIFTIGSGRGKNLTNAVEKRLGKCDWPAWSPDKKRIALSFSLEYSPSLAFANGCWAIWIIDADGKNCRPLTAVKKGDEEINSADSKERRRNDTQPSWSPDGKKVAFLRVYMDGGRTKLGKEAYKELCIVNVDDTEQSCIIAIGAKGKQKQEITKSNF